MRARGLIAAASIATFLLRSASGRAEDAATSADFRVNTVTDKIQQSPSIAATPRGAFVVAWQSEIPGSGDDIRARVFDARGAPQGDEFAVNEVNKGNQNAPALAMDAKGNFVVVWQSIAVSHYVIRARCFDASGTPK